MDEETSSRLGGVFGEHYDEVLAYCARRIGRTEAEDTAAEVFAVASRRVEEIDWETVRPWLYGIARGVLANRWRSIHRLSRVRAKMAGLAANPAQSLDEVVVRNAEARKALATLRRLRPPDQEILMLAAWEGLTASQIAQSLGITVTATEKRLERAKHRFAQALHPGHNANSASIMVIEEGDSR